MSAQKTQPSSQSADAFIRAIADPMRRKECRTLARMMKKATGSPGRVWGRDMVGFGSYHYKYPTGHEGDWFLTGFSPRKTALTLYLMPGFESSGDLLKRLGPHKTGKSCLYLKSLDGIEIAVLEALIDRSVNRLREMYP